MVGKQTVRQQARSRAREVRKRRQAEQAERERRLSRLGEDVAVALAERDAAALRAGERLHELMGEGLSTRQALEWCCVDGLTTREAQRLARAATGEHGDDEEPGNQEEPAAVPEPDPHAVGRVIVEDGRVGTGSTGA